MALVGRPVLSSLFVLFPWSGLRRGFPCFFVSSRVVYYNVIFFKLKNKL